VLKLFRRAYAIFKAYFMVELVRSRGIVYGLLSMAMWIILFTMPIALFSSDTIELGDVSARIFTGVIVFMFYGMATWDWAAEIRWMINEGRVDYYIASGAGFLPHYLGLLPVSLMWLGISLTVNYTVLSLLWAPPKLLLVDPLIFIYGFLMLLLCLIGYALILGGTMLSTGVTGFIIEIVSFILPIATGGLLPLRYMPEPLKSIALATPFSYPAELIRFSLLGIEPVVGVWRTVVLSLLYVPLFLLIGIIYFKYQLRRSLREGFKTISMW